ncbi:hypothetical protein ACHAWF_004390 [Thalassiosira exigua]
MAQGPQRQRDGGADAAPPTLHRRAQRGKSQVARSDRSPTTMREAAGKRAFATLAALGALSSSGPELSPFRHRAAAFAPPSARPEPTRTTDRWRRRSRRLREGVALSAVGTKRPRTAAAPEAEPLASEPEGGAAHRLDGPSKPKITFELLPDFMQKDPLLVTKQKWLEKTAPPPPSAEEESAASSRRDREMMAMSTATFVLAVGVVYALASSTPDMVEPASQFNVVRDANVERIEIAARNVVGTVLPQNAEDVIAVSIGEGIAGAIGAFATWLLGMALNFKGDEDFVVTPMEGGSELAMAMERRGAMDSLVSEAVADGDYFLTRAAAEPLLEALGIPVFFASLASVLIATLPYEAVKLSSQKRRMESEDKLLLDMLLEEEERRKREMSVVDQVSNRAFDFLQRLYVQPVDVGDDVEYELLDEMSGASDEKTKNVPTLDYVELFADITKWLEYDVLISNYRGVLAMPNGQMLPAGWESAIFGLLAALSSQLYTDVLYLYSDFGDPLKREKTINRELAGWASVYATKCLSAATLFGVYEAVRAPTSRLMGQLFSGGSLACLGSADYDLCMETYLVDNPSSVTFETDIGAFLDSFTNWINIP